MSGPLPASPRVLRVHRLGRVEYPAALRLMALAKERVACVGAAGTDHLFVVEHPPVFTLGRGADARNVLASSDWLRREGVEVHSIDRGGDVTYHGPGQIVAYPVLDLSGARDLRRYVWTLEEAMIQTCADHGVEAGRHGEHRGTWVGRGKIGAVGVRVSRWITSHGCAFNVEPDLARFDAIVPCGIRDPALGVTSLSAELRAQERPPARTSVVEDRLVAHLVDLLGRSRRDAAPDLQTVVVFPVGEDGRVLLLRRDQDAHGPWTPIAATVRDSERAEAAARRAVLKTVGGEATQLVPVYRHAFPLEQANAGDDPLRVVEESAFAAHLSCADASAVAAAAGGAWLDPAKAAEALRLPGWRRAVCLAVAPTPRCVRGMAGSGAAGIDR